MCSVVCRSVCLSVGLSVCHTSEPCKKGCTDGDVVLEDSGGPKEPWESIRSFMGRGNFVKEKGRPIVKYRDTLQSPVQKQLNQSICHLGYGLGWAVGIMC